MNCESNENCEVINNNNQSDTKIKTTIDFSGCKATLNVVAKFS